MRTEIVKNYPDGTPMANALFFADGLLIECQELSVVLGYQETSVHHEYSGVRINSYTLGKDDGKTGLIQRTRTGWCLMIPAEDVVSNMAQLIFDLGKKIDKKTNSKVEMTNV